MSICILVMVLGMLPTAFGATKTFTPTPADLGDLAHAYYYTWGINWVVPSGKRIKEATLTIKNINNWTWEDEDRLFIHLLDNPTKGVKQYTDNQKGGDNFEGQGVVVATYTDKNESKAETLTYKFSSLGLLDTLKKYSKDGKFGFGFDPDCHYTNSGITFSIETEPDTPVPTVPEPSSIIGLIGTLAGLGFAFRRK